MSKSNKKTANGLTPEKAGEAFAVLLLVVIIITITAGAIRLIAWMFGY